MKNIVVHAGIQKEISQQILNSMILKHLDFIYKVQNGININPEENFHEKIDNKIELISICPPRLNPSKNNFIEVQLYKI